jgi:hypothetical protein
MRETPKGGRSARRFAAVAAVAAALGASAATQDTAVAACPTPNTPNPYPNCTYPTPQSFGMFDGLATSAVAFNSQDSLATKSYFGMPHQHTIWDYFLHNDKGKFYLGSNSILGPGGSLTSFPWFGVGAFQGPGPGDPPGLTPDPRTHAWVAGAPATQTLTPGGKVQVDATTSVGGQQITYDRNSFKYTSANNEINLTGTPTGGGTQFNHPWREPDGTTNAFFYIELAYKVEGTYQGEHVKGHVTTELFWSDVAYRASWWVRNRIGQWSFFNVDYKDGSSAMGQVMCGEYGFRGAIIADEKNKAVVRDDRMNVYVKPYGYLYEFANGQKWKFLNDPKNSLGTGVLTGRTVPVGGKKVKSADSVVINPGIAAGASPCAPQKLNGDPGHGHGHH